MSEKIAQLEEKARENTQKYADLQTQLEPIKAEKDMVLKEYQREKIIMGISHDEQKIQNRLNELANVNLAKQSPKYVILMAENQRILDSISERNYQIILKELEPEKQKKLLELQEDREKIRTYIHSR